MRLRLRSAGFWRFGAVAACVWLLVGCQAAPAKPPGHADPAADRLRAERKTAAQAAATSAKVVDQLLDELLGDEPGWGRSLGLHQYDGKVSAYSAQAIGARIQRLQRAQASLAGLPKAAANSDLALDIALVSGAVDSQLFTLVDWDAWRKNPLFYQGLFAVNDYLDRNYAPLEQRARQLLAHEEAALLEVGNVLQNLVGPLPRPIVETAIKVFAGYAEYLRGDVVRLLHGVGDGAFQARLAETNAAFASEAQEIGKRLQAMELDRNATGYALGAERYAKFVRIQEGLSLSLDAFSSMADADLAANKRAYEALSKTVRETRPSAAQVLQEAQRVTEAAFAFTAQHAIATLPEQPPPVVRETPPFMRWNQAFLVAPGPFDREGLEAYYYITLPDRGWPRHKREQYLMTRGTLVSTTVHETYPGHFLQGAFTRRAPTRAQKSIGSYSFSEGWAHYVEQMMADEGFAADDPETRLGQLSDALLRDCRFIASIGLHARAMTVEQAERKFIEDCHQDRASAHEQAVRGTFDPGYFAYTLGKLQILALREEARQRLGPRFSLQRFHDALLSHGTSPVPLIRERVLAQLEIGGGKP